jgi:hypothetical protein
MRKFVKGRAAWERFVDEQGGRDIVSRPDCSIMIGTRRSAISASAGASASSRACATPTFDVMWGQGAAEAVEAGR